MSVRLDKAHGGFTKTEAALLEALERERALLRQRDLVNGIVLHEMSNAVAVVMGAAELIRHHGASAPTFHFAMQRILSGTQMMDEMLGGLRVLLGENGAEPVFEQGDLAAFVRETVTDPLLVTESAVRRVRVVSRLNEEEKLHCPALLRHALGNLVRNALRYSPSTRPVTVIIGGRGRQRWIHVLNRGPKISSKIAAQLFEPGRKSAKGGMGFGLHITQACALRMGGRLVFGTTGKVTVFSILLGSNEGRIISLQGLSEIREAVSQ